MNFESTSASNIPFKISVAEGIDSIDPTKITTAGQVEIPRNSANWDNENVLDDTEMDTILAKFATLPISTYDLTTNSVSKQHIGFTAADFHSTFGYGASGSVHTNPADESSLALMAIKRLYYRIVAAETACATNCA